jgi:iron complex outermembrane receptor protein
MKSVVTGFRQAWFKLTAPAILVLVLPPLSAAPQSSTPHALADASLEDLMNIEVTSVSRKEETLSRTPAAVFVIGRDDIRRSGATNIPDLLRMAPGVNVERIDANTWAISIRGFDSRYSDKILVLIDGRSIYSPSFSGVYWDQLDVPLEDIERIEVIRGPGGTVWGANAMNGVINIITLSSKATQGGLLVAEAGSKELGGLAQFGGKAGAAGTWRAFGRYFNTDSSVTPVGGAAADVWHGVHEGFRADLEPSPRDTVMVQGDLYKTGEGQTLTTVLSGRLPAVATLNDPVSVDSGDLQARWSHTLQNGSDTSLNVYYNHVNRLDQRLLENLNSVDIDFQHHFAINSRNDVVWGLAYRVTSDKMNSGYDTLWFPPQRTDTLYSAFVRDEIKLARSAWFTIGTKLEHNAYTGFEYEPGAQFVWTPTDRQTIWLSASQAIRQPSRQDTDLQYDIAVIPLEGSNFGVLKFINNKNIRAEQLRDYETGYRAQVTKRLSLDVAAFRSYYRRLETTDPGDPYFVDSPGPPHAVFPLNLGNGARARTYGGEVFATWNVTRRWRISPGYSLAHVKVIQNPLSQNSTAGAIPGDTPEHQIQFRSSLGLRSNLDWDTSLYFVGRLSDAQVPAYTRLDMQLRWRPLESVEFSIAGQNLLMGRHMELDDAFEVKGTQVQRSVFGRITWRF